MLFLKKILKILGNFKTKIPFLSFIIFFNSMLDVIGISFLPILINIIMNKQNEVYFLKIIKINSLTNNYLGIICLFIALFFIIKSIISFFIQKSILTFAYSLRKSIVMKIIKSYNDLEFEKIFKKKSSDLILNSITHVGQFTDGVIIPLARSISEFLVIIGLFILLAIENLIAMLILMFIILSIFLLYYMMIRIRLFVYGKRMSESEGLIIKNISYIVDGFREIKLFNKGHFFNRKIDNNLNIYKNSGINSRSIQLIPRYLFEVSIIVFVMSLIYISTEYNLISTQNLIALLGLFVIAAIRIIPSINTISLSISTMRSSAYAINKLYDDLVEKVRSKTVVDTNKNNITFEFNKFEINDLSFGYKINQQLTLDKVNFNFRNGDIIGICGESGSGKSTLVDLILGLLKTKNGSINIFDEKGKNILGSDYNNIKLWQSKVAYIPQETFLIDESIYTNISMEDEEKNIDLNKIKYSLDKSLLSNIYTNNDDYINKKIGEKGEYLSGGQRQRLAFARSLYTNRKIFVLDEFTSSLDQNTEKELFDFIYGLRGEFTIIIISHNVNMLSRCDKLFQIKNKNVIRIK